MIIHLSYPVHGLKHAAAWYLPVRQNLDEVKLPGSLGVSLLSAQSFSLLLAALALRCKQCSSYFNKKCKHEVKTCIAEDGESCMITRIWALPHSGKW